MADEFASSHKQSTTKSACLMLAVCWAVLIFQAAPFVRAATPTVAFSSAAGGQYLDLGSPFTITCNSPNNPIQSWTRTLAGVTTTLFSLSTPSQSPHAVTPNGDTLTVASATDQTGGVYTCINDASSSNSASVRVDVLHNNVIQASDMVSITMDNSTGLPTEPLNLTCIVDVGPGLIQPDWCKVIDAQTCTTVTNSDYKAEKRSAIALTRTYGESIIQFTEINAYATDAYPYRCSFKLDADHVANPAIFNKFDPTKVYSKQVLLHLPPLPAQGVTTDVLSHDGETAKLICNFGSLPLGTITWQFKNESDDNAGFVPFTKHITRADDYSIKNSTDQATCYPKNDATDLGTHGYATYCSVLTIKSLITAEDRGNYSCTADNGWPPTSTVFVYLRAQSSLRWLLPLMVLLAILVVSILVMNYAPDKNDYAVEESENLASAAEAIAAHQESKRAEGERHEIAAAAAAAAPPSTTGPVVLPPGPPGQKQPVIAQTRPVSFGQPAMQPPPAMSPQPAQRAAAMAGIQPPPPAQALPRSPQPLQPKTSRDVINNNITNATSRPLITGGATVPEAMTPRPMAIPVGGEVRLPGVKQAWS